MSRKNHILLFGGTFDPIHNGHLTIVRDAAAQLQAGKVYLIPSARPPHKQASAVTPAEHRLAMCHLAVGDDPLFEVSDCETRRDGPSYTIDTVKYFRKELGGGAHLYWLIGADTLADLPDWRRIGRLLEKCTIVTAARPGYDPSALESLRGALSEEQINRIREHVLATPLVDISATEIRRRIEQGKPIEGQLSPAVVDYINRYNLYRDAACA